MTRLLLASVLALGVVAYQFFRGVEMGIMGAVCHADR
jgi:hypothetical protein